MTLDLLMRTLGWCAVVHYAILLLWVLLVLAARDTWMPFQERLFGITAEHARAINYAGIALYKLGILLLNVVPYLVLRLILGGGGG